MPYSNTPLLHWLSLASLAPFKKLDFSIITKFFTDLPFLFSQPASSLLALGLSPSLTHNITTFQNWAMIEETIRYTQKHNIVIVTYTDPLYSQRLRRISCPPLVLFAKGDLSLLNYPRQIAMVGSRSASQEGIEIAIFFSNTLTQLGFIIVSGLAKGIDRASHEGALAQGPTIAVLGCGFPYTYPQEHSNLQAAIVDKGLIITEFFPHVPPKARNFPYRNRIITGLSEGLVVIEAGLKSGSIISANCAITENREVFVIPGSILNKSNQGSHQLIQQGAKLVTEVQDILSELPPLLVTAPTLLSTLSGNLSAIAYNILQNLGSGATLEDLAARLQAPKDELFLELLALESKNIIVCRLGLYAKR